MKTDVILRVGVKLILPFIFLCALYVHFHGDYSPGGGFQAGVIAAAVVILSGLVFGMKTAMRIAPPHIVRLLIPAGVAIFILTGVPSLFFDKPYLDYSIYGHDLHHARERGIMLVELGVLTTVFATMVGIFYAFVERGRG